MILYIPRWVLLFVPIFLISGCGTTELFQRKAKEIPEYSEQDIELLRQSADLAERRADEMATASSQLYDRVGELSYHARRTGEEVVRASTFVNDALTFEPADSPTVAPLNQANAHLGAAAQANTEVLQRIPPIQEATSTLRGQAEGLEKVADAAGTMVGPPRSPFEGKDEDLSLEMIKARTEYMREMRQFREYYVGDVQGEGIAGSGIQIPNFALTFVAIGALFVLVIVWKLFSALNPAVKVADTVIRGGGRVLSQAAIQTVKGVDRASEELAALIREKTQDETLARAAVETLKGGIQKDQSPEVQDMIKILRGKHPAYQAKLKVEALGKGDKEGLKGIIK